MATLMRQTTMSKDPQLEQDIERNLRLRDGAKRILSIAGNSIQRLDAEKTMLVSNARLVVSLRQLQQEKVLEANAAVSGCELSSSLPSSNPSRVGRAKLCLSYIRIPLLWRDNNVLMANSTMTLNKLCDFNVLPSTAAGSLRPLSMSSDSSELSPDSYAAFCIVKVGNQIEETRLLCDIVPGTADLEFDDVLNFEDVMAGFHCIIELYAYPRASSKTSFLRRKSSLDYASSWRHTTLFDSLSPIDIKDTMSSADVSIMGTASTSTCFALVARYVARLNDVSDTISAHTLDTASCLSHTMAFVTDQHSQAALRRDSTLKASSSSATTGSQSSQSPVTHFDESCEIPLFGPICFRLAAQPYSLEKPLHRGLLWIRALNVAPEQEAARLYDCQLKGQCLFARLIRPTERSTTVKTPDISHVTDHRKQASESGRFAAVKSPAKVRLRVPSRWDLILKIDSDTELLDEAPKPRLVLLSTYSLTPSEVNLLAETSLPLKTYPAEETKVREGKDVGSKSQGHQRVSSDGLVLQAPTASGGDGLETVPVEEQSNQDSVSSASIDSVSEMPPVISQGSPESGACDTACAIESEHDSTNHQSGSERGYTANSDLTQVKGEKHDANSSPNPVSSACADTVSPIGHEFVAKMESSDREVTVGSNCVADLLSHEVTSNGVPKITGESKTHHEVSSVHRRCSIPAEGHHLRESIHTEARMRSISLPSQQMGEDELNEVSSLPMASDEVALMRTRKASLMLAESDKSNQISSPGCHSATPLSPSNEVIVAPVSPPLFLSRQRHSLDSPNKYARKKMVKTLTRSLDRSIPLSLSLGGSSSVSLTPGKPDSGGNCRTYYRRLSLPESVSVCVSSQFSTSLISRPDRDSTEGGSKHDGVAVTQTTTDDAYQTGSENVSLLSDPAFVAATADDEREESSALTTSRANGSGGDGMEEQEKADSRSVSGRQRTSEMPSPLRRRLATFHVATNPVSGPDVSFSQSRMSEDDSLLKVVYEISAFEVFSRQSAEGPAQEEEGDITPTAMKSGLKEEEDDKLNCGGSTNAWFSAIQAHLKEQAEWGARVFNKVMTIAEATSFTKKGSIIRASAFLDNLNIPEFSLEAVAAKRSGDLPTTVL